jgi:hypothetical protein
MPKRKYRHGDVLFLSDKSTAHIFMKTLFNPYWDFKVLTKPLDAGTYAFKIVAEDDVGNVSLGKGDKITIGEDVVAPYDVEVEAENSDVTLTWESPIGIEPDGYKIYSNNGSGFVDRSAPLAIIPSGSTETHTFSGLGAGDWLFVIESYLGSVESLSYYVKAVTLPTTQNVPHIPTDDPQTYDGSMIVATNVDVGKIGLSFMWLYGAEAAKFRMYCDFGTGTIYWGTYFEFARQEGYLQEYTTPQVYNGKDKATFKFVLRAVSAAGVADTNTNEYSVELRGQRPDAPDMVQLVSVY